jgi:hypothetical protein
MGNPIPGAEIQLTVFLEEFVTPGGTGTLVQFCKIGLSFASERTRRLKSSTETKGIDPFDAEITEPAALDFTSVPRNRSRKSWSRTRSIGSGNRSQTRDAQYFAGDLGSILQFLANPKDEESQMNRKSKLQRLPRFFVLPGGTGAEHFLAGK